MANDSAGVSIESTRDTTRHRTALQAYVRSLYPEQLPLTAFGALCGLDGAPRYDVLTAPEPCERCGTVVVLLQREDRPGPIWYQVGDTTRVEAGMDVTFLRHDDVLCRVARRLMSPTVTESGSPAGGVMPFA